MRFQVRFGQAELTQDADPGRPNGWLLSVDGVPQSYVDLDDPGHLRFEYVRYIGLVLECLSPGTLEALHIGAGGFTIARYLAHTRPGSPQLAFELDERLLEIVRQRLRLEEIPSLRVRVCDGRIGISECANGSFDVIVVDAWTGGTMTPGLVTADFLGEAARVLRTGGCLVANLAGGPELEFMRRAAATAREAFAHVLILGDAAVLSGLVFGHFILAASPAPRAVASIAGHIASLQPGRLATVQGEALEILVGECSPFRH